MMSDTPQQQHTLLGMWLLLFLTARVHCRSIVGYGDYTGQGRIGPLVADPLAPADATAPQDGEVMMEHINIGVSAYDQQTRMSYNVVVNMTGGHWLAGTHAITGNRTVWIPLQDPPAVHIVYVPEFGAMLGVGTVTNGSMSYAVIELDLESGAAMSVGGLSRLDQGGDMLLSGGVAFDMLEKRYYVLLMSHAGGTVLYRLQVTSTSSPFQV